MKTLLIGLLALGSFSAFAQTTPWYQEGNGSILSLIKNKPEQQVLNSIFKQKLKKFERNVVKELRNSDSFSDLSKTVLGTGLKLNQITAQRPNLLATSSDGKTVTWQSSVISRKTGKEVLSVGLVCKYIESHIDPETCGEYCYRDASEVFTCLVEGIR